MLKILGFYKNCITFYHSNGLNSPKDGIPVKEFKLPSLVLLEAQTKDNIFPLSHLHTTDINT